MTTVARKKPKQVSRAPVRLKPADSQVFLVPISWIDISHSQVRDYVTEKGIDEMAASLKKNGQIHPVTLRKVGPHEFHLVAGQRRFLGARRAGWTHIEARFRKGTLSDVDALCLSFAENVNREAMSPIDEAHRCRDLRTKYKLPVREIAERLGKDDQWVYGRLRILDLPEEIQSRIRDNHLGVTGALLLTSVIHKDTPRHMYNPLIRKLDQIGWKLEHVRHAVHQLKESKESPRGKRAGQRFGRPLEIDPVVNLENKMRGIKTAVAHVTTIHLSRRSKEELRRMLVEARVVWHLWGRYLKEIQEALGERAEDVEERLAARDAARAAGVAAGE